MKNWKPPLKPDPWYSHIFRVLLRRNSRRRAAIKKAKKVAKGAKDK